MVQSSASDKNESNENEIQVEPMNFMYSFRPIYYVSWIFGVMPFSIVYDLNGGVLRPKVTRFDGFWFVILVCLYVSSAFLVRSPPGTHFTLMLLYILSILGFIYSFSAIIFNMCYRSKFIDILKRITTFDNEVRRVWNCFIQLIKRFYNIFIFLFHTDDECGNAIRLQKEMQTQLAVLHRTNIGDIWFADFIKCC